MNIYKSSIDQNKIYKQQEKLKKESEKKQQQLQKKIEQLKAKREKHLEKMKKDLDHKYKKELEKYERKQRLNFEKLKRKIEGKKPLKKYEKNGIKGLKNKVFEAIQKYARLRDSDSIGFGKCISCGKKIHWSKADGGHYVSRANMSTAFDQENINLQCKHCNGMLHGNLVEYRKNLIKKIGLKRVERLESLKHKTRKRTKGELENLLSFYTEINKDLESKKGKLLKSK